MERIPPELQDQDQPNAASTLRLKIRHIFNYIKDSVQNHQHEPSFSLIDTDLSTTDLFSADHHCLMLDRDRVKMKTVRLVGNSFTFHKIVKFLDHLDRELVSRENMDVNVRKRALYYGLVGDGFTSTGMVDEYIAYAC